MFGLRRGSKAIHDPMPGVDRIDHLIDLEHRRDIDRLTVLIELRDHGLEKVLAFARIRDGFHLLAKAESNCALESHAAELTGRPRDREILRVKPPASHGLRTKAVALAQNDGE